MFEIFFYSLQQNIKLFLVFPILCAIFRILFIAVYNPYGTLKGRWNIAFACFHYGFWWGMDFNAYMFLIPLIFVSLPAAFFPFFAEYGDVLRVIIGLTYAVILYTAFMGKMIFYRHFHDTYNYLIHMGKHAEKHNLIDIFFNQDHGLAILLGYIPYIAVMVCACWGIQQLPSVPYPVFKSSVVQYGFNVVVFLGSILGFYWVRFGGTLKHRNKPEWDTIPSIVKEDAFFAKACIDDLIALKWIRRRGIVPQLELSEEQLELGITSIMPQTFKENWKTLSNPLLAFKRVAQGPYINKPRHVFFIVGESIPQWVLDDMYSGLHILDGTVLLKDDKHTAYISNFLPAGNVSRPSIVSLMSGVYDAQLELNEQEYFWHTLLPTSFAGQMKKLGYQTIYWYGGNASNGNFNHFGKGQGFDRVESATNFCSPDAPKTWVGVYDKVFLEKTADLIEQLDKPTFHFIYTTTMHGPYKLPDSLLDYNPEQMMENIGEDLRTNKSKCKELATARYSDQAICSFIDRMKQAFPDSLFVYTGDHSQIYADLSGTSLVPRDYMFRERFCTPLLIHHPQITQGILKDNKIGTHLNIIPTIIELIAPKGFEYYSLFSSLTIQGMNSAVTPKQWITDTELGEIASGQAEPVEECSKKGCEKYNASQSPYIVESSGYVDLSVWMVRNKNRLENR